MDMALKDTVRFVGDLMELAARTAPKGRGEDLIEVIVLTEDERMAVGNDMIQIGKERSDPGFERDGRNVLDSDAVVFIGLLAHKGVGLNCGACGHSSCDEFDHEKISIDFDGPNCAIRLLDLGIALGSAVKIASELNVDNRIMYRIGVSVKRLGIGRSCIGHGIPLSATGKNIFFDRNQTRC
jgi:uncharacterized ferredoxin-like protein